MTNNIVDEVNPADLYIVLILLNCLTIVSCYHVSLEHEEISVIDIAGSDI